MRETWRHGVRSWSKSSFSCTIRISGYGESQTAKIIMVMLLITILLLLARIVFVVITVLKCPLK